MNEVKINDNIKRPLITANKLTIRLILIKALIIWQPSFSYMPQTRSKTHSAKDELYFPDD